MEELRVALGTTWAETVVVCVTEFGRTVAGNGTDGTDHGSGGVMLLAGGAVRGGRVLTDWPGLAPASLFEGRDVRTTTDTRAVLAAVLREHMGIAAEGVFPDLVGHVEGLARS